MTLFSVSFFHRAWCTFAIFSSNRAIETVPICDVLVRFLVFFLFFPPVRAREDDSERGECKSRRECPRVNE